MEKIIEFFLTPDVGIYFIGVIIHLIIIKTIIEKTFHGIGGDAKFAAIFFWPITTSIIVGFLCFLVIVSPVILISKKIAREINKNC